MKASRMKTIAIRAVTLGALLASATGVAMAQKAKPSGPPVTTKGAAKSNPKADKGQANAQHKRTEAREEKAEKSALGMARKEHKALLKGIKFTPDQEKAVDAIEKKYAGQFKDLEKADKVTDKAGTPDAAYLAKIDALRLQERAELRAALTPAQRIEFDQNITTLGADKK